MEVNRKSENLNLTKKHFSKIHERIQLKYTQMQKKIEKSKSVDALPSLSDDFNFNDEQHIITTENSACDDNVFDEIKSDTGDFKRSVHNVIIEDINKQATIDAKDIIFHESEVTPSIEEDNFEFFDKNDLNLSLDSIYEASSTEEIFQSPSPKITLREKFIAARERRRDRREQKKEHKIKKFERDSSDKLVLSNKRISDSAKKKTRIASVIVALIEGTGPEKETVTEDKTRQLHCRMKLGIEKYKSKAAKYNGKVVSWQELCTLSYFEDNILELSVWEKDIFIGRTLVDLLKLEHEETYRMDLSLENGELPLKVVMLITISGKSMNTLDLYDDEKRQIDLAEMKKKYSWPLRNDKFAEVGGLSVIIFGAKGLSSSDSFADLTLENTRVRTQTENKTNDPNWMRLFTFKVMDVTSILEITIYDEKKSEITGRLAISLLAIQNGKAKWYALKDATMRERAKGKNPRILLEMTFYFNLVKASVRVINPKERILLQTEPEFSRQRFASNISRIKAVYGWIAEAIIVFKKMFEWDNVWLNLTALTAWLIFWYNFRAWMLPILLLIPFVWYRPEKYKFITIFPKHLDKDTDDDAISIKSGNSKTLFQKLNSLSEMVTTVQNGIGKAASLGESFKNLFNFTVPFLSLFSIFCILVISLILHYVPSRYLLMGWGVHKFLRKIVRPNRIPNNEFMDLLSRVPDDETLANVEELPLLGNGDDDVN